MFSHRGMFGLKSGYAANTLLAFTIIVAVTMMGLGML
jgi:hypothetical protein